MHSFKCRFFVLPVEYCNKMLPNRILIELLRFCRDQQFAFWTLCSGTELCISQWTDSRLGFLVSDDAVKLTTENACEMQLSEIDGWLKMKKNLAGRNKCNISQRSCENCR
jgi:hypothetical protein